MTQSTILLKETLPNTIATTPQIEYPFDLSLLVVVLACSLLQSTICYLDTAPINFEDKNFENQLWLMFKVVEIWQLIRPFIILLLGVVALDKEWTFIITFGQVSQLCFKFLKQFQGSTQLQHIFSTNYSRYIFPHLGGYWISRDFSFAISME